MISQRLLFRPKRTYITQQIFFCTKSSSTGTATAQVSKTATGLSTQGQITSKLKALIKNYSDLSKFRLSSLVVATSVVGND